MPHSVKREAAKSESVPFVFLLHGLLMPAASMIPLERGLRQAGFASRRVSYPTRARPWQQSVEILRREVEECASNRIHFVGHSMGGLMVTALLNDSPMIASGSVVTIGTPFNGSSVARNMLKYSPGRWFLSGAESLLASGLQPRWSDSRALHVIAGTRGIGLPRVLFGKELGAVHDGVVSVDECTPEVMASMDTFSSNHTLLLVNQAVIERVVSLLKDH
jgi:pimeloyl-ACP methyl ester carboxylesterase